MEFSRKNQIKYNWWCEDETVKEIDFDIQEQLEEHAEQRINEMRKEGYTSGELCAVVCDIEYRGWWSFKYV